MCVFIFVSGQTVSFQMVLRMESHDNKYNESTKTPVYMWNKMLKTITKNESP